MKRPGTITLFLLFVLVARGAIHASDPTAAYVIVDRVVFEPTERAAERIQIWGAYSVAKPNDRSDYLPPQRGYMYFQLPAAGGERAIREWHDFAMQAGRREIVGFGSRYSLVARLRPDTEKPAAPDTYTLESGLYRVRADTSYAPMKALLDFSAR
jgi:hypothetical protein